METAIVIHHSSTAQPFFENGFEDAFYNSRLRYSLRHVAIIGNISQENIREALQKSLQVCRLAGINGKHHFKKIYVFDSTFGIMHTDWLMSKNGFNLMVMQMPSLTEPMARWLWELADSKRAFI